MDSISENSSDGYTLEVDLKYPDKQHNDYPLAPEKYENSNMLSPYYSEIVDKYRINIDRVKKLVPNLGNKSKYVLHYRNIELHLLLGVKLTRAHRVLKFKQFDWMKT